MCCETKIENYFQKPPEEKEETAHWGFANATSFDSEENTKIFDTEIKENYFSQDSFIAVTSLKISNFTF